MPKMKTNKSVAKRFKVTGKGKVRRGQAFKSHILTKKSRDRKRRLRKGAYVDATDAPRIHRLIGK